MFKTLKEVGKSFFFAVLISRNLHHYSKQREIQYTGASETGGHIFDTWSMDENKEKTSY